MTDEGLLFIDYDIDTRPEDIKYNHHALLNGITQLASGQGMVAVPDVYWLVVDVVIDKQQIFISQ